MSSAPTQSPTNHPEEDIKINLISNEKNKFLVEIKIKDNSIIIISCCGEINYESEFSLTYLKKYIPYDTLYECVNQIKDGINSGKISIEEYLDYFTLTIILNNSQKVLFKVEKKIKNENENKISNEIGIELKEQKEGKIKNDEIKTDTAKPEDLELKKIILEQQKEILELKNQVKELMVFKKHFEDGMIVMNSNIIRNIGYNLRLKDYINPNKIIKAKLLYSLSKDGDSCEVFHCLCDNISPTLVLIESQEGFIFGGYTTCTWEMSNKIKKDYSFLFSLTRNQKMERITRDFYNDPSEDRDIYCGVKYGPNFGNNELYFEKTMRKFIVDKEKYYKYNFLSSFSYLPSSSEAKEVEVFQILTE